MTPNIVPIRLSSMTQSPLIKNAINKPENIEHARYPTIL
jgi:hypothetical protein